MLSSDSYELKNENFLNIYLEDYNRLKKESEQILEEAELFRQAGDAVSYLTLVKKYETYRMALETMVVMAIKKPLADA